MEKRLTPVKRARRVFPQGPAKQNLPRSALALLVRYKTERSKRIPLKTLETTKIYASLSRLINIRISDFGHNAGQDVLGIRVNGMIPAKAG